MWGLFGIGIGLTVLGIAISISGWLERRRGRSSANWPSVSGEIIASEEIHDTEYGPPSPGLRYRYQVDGRTFEGDRITFKCRPITRATTKALLSEHPEGWSVLVYYNPVSPESSALQQGVSTLQESVYVTLVGAAFLAFGLIILWASYQDAGY